MSQEASHRPDQLLDRLRGLGRLEPRLIGPSGKRPPTSELNAGRFTVFGKPVSLLPPVEWAQDPYGNRSWCYELHTLTWLKPLLLAYAEERDAASLTLARELLLDWASTHLEPAGEISGFAWYDMAVGLRAPYFAFVLRESLVANALDASDANLLLRAAERHGAELADDDNYAAGHNHGLYQDEGLYLLAKQLPALPRAEAWREIALRRLRTTLEQTISFEEGAHLEHSSAYQFSTAGLVSRLAENVPEMPELPELRDRLRQTAAWHVTPANRLAQLGDTDDVPAPKWAQRAAAQQHGLNSLFETGQAFVREGDSYLAASAGYHSAAHKHADDTGFILVENGVTILGDTGRWGYHEEEPDRLYARSARAHNVLTVDGEDFQWRDATPYGSGLLAAHEKGGWHTILMHNPLLHAHAVTHQRVLLYKPHIVLLVIDYLRASEEHEYERHFHFGASLDAAFDDTRTVTISDRHPIATLVDLTNMPTDSTARSAPDGSMHSGWSYPSDRERLSTRCATFCSRSSDACLVAALRPL